MARQIKAMLDDVEFTIPALNIAQLQEVADVIAQPNVNRNGFDLLRIIMRRATPQPDWETFAPNLADVGTTIQAVFGLSGLQQRGEQGDPLLVVEGGKK